MSGKDRLHLGDHEADGSNEENDSPRNVDCVIGSVLSKTPPNEQANCACTLFMSVWT